MTPLIVNRHVDEGLNIFFYNLRTLMIFNHEITFQLGSLWNDTNVRAWEESNLFLTSGKSNVRTEMHLFSEDIYTEYNLKRILKISTAYERIKVIGALCNSELLDISSLSSVIVDGVDGDAFCSAFRNQSEFNFNEWMEGVIRYNPDTIIPMVIEDYMMETFFRCYNEYTNKMIRDDLGMIQNTMRNLIRN